MGRQRVAGTGTSAGVDARITAGLETGAREDYHYVSQTSL